MTVSSAQGGLVSAGTGIAELLLSEGRVFGHVHDQHSVGDPLHVGPAGGAKMTTQPLVRLVPGVKPAAMVCVRFWGSRAQYSLTKRKL